MTDRDPLATITRRQRRDVRFLFRTLAESVTTALDAQDGPERVVTEADRARAMRAVEEGLDAIFGARANDPDAALRHIILRDTQRARLVPLKGAVADWRKALPGALRERVEQEARD